MKHLILATALAAITSGAVANNAFAFPDIAGIATNKETIDCNLQLAHPELVASPQFIENAYDKMKIKMLQNISPNKNLDNLDDVSQGFYKGAVLAAPSKENPDLGTPNYQYHWRRDGGITINMLFDLYMDSKAKKLPDQDYILQILMDALAEAKHFQDTPNNEGRAEVYWDGNTKKYYPNMGAAKQHMDMTPLTVEGWMDPQTDGPAYTTKGLLRIAREVWDDWNHIFTKDNRNRNVRTNLQRSDIYNTDGAVDENKSIIKRFLEYMDHNWWVQSFEMWEEDKGRHFATIGAHQAVLLIEGPEFTKKVGDPGAGEEYRKTAMIIEEELKQFWDPVKKIIFPSRNVEYSGPANQGHPKLSPIDSQVVIGLCHMKSPTFSPASDYALSTVAQHDAYFEGAYPVNGGQPYALYGRYPGDVYSGSSKLKKEQPWFLTTFYYAEHSYKTADELKTRGKISVNDLNVNFFNHVLRQSGEKIQVKEGMTIDSSDPMFTTIMTSLVKRGDGIIQRALQFAGPDGSMSEQIDPSGDGVVGLAKQRSAPSLTWSYAAFFRAIKARQVAVNKLIGQN